MAFAAPSWPASWLTPSALIRVPKSHNPNYELLDRKVTAMKRLIRREETKEPKQLKQFLRANNGT